MKVERSLIVTLGAAVAIPLASYQRGMPSGAAIAAAAALLLAAGVTRSRRPMRDLTIFGVVLHLFGFYWLASTITLFGGFPAPISWLLFSLYAVISSLQFTLCGWLFSKFRASALERYGFALASAWLVTEWGVPRLFPWYLSHFLLPWRAFAGMAEFVGEAPLSAILLWWATILVGLVRRDRRVGVGSAAMLMASVAAIAISSVHQDALEKSFNTAPSVDVALIQGNLGTREKDDVQSFVVDVEQYRTLSLKAKQSGAEFIVWPESSVVTWIPEEVKSLRGLRGNPAPDLGLPLLYGGLMFRKRSAEEQRAIVGDHPDPLTVERETPRLFKFFNSAIGLDGAGNIAGRYHKKVLMPFGEYLPFADLVPAIKSLSPHTGDFTSGDLSDPIPFTVGSGNQSMLVGPLVCYEDLIPALARDAVRRGAHVLINLTNDVWYGRTAAPYQHHILASWRAIETRRFLLRSTNTGLTAIVTPFGETVAEQPIFASGTARARVQLLSVETFYVQWGELPVKGFLLLLFLAAWCTYRRPDGQAG